MIRLILIALALLIGCSTTPEPYVNLTPQAFRWGANFETGNFSQITHPCDKPGGEVERDGFATVVRGNAHAGNYYMIASSPYAGSAAGFSRQTCEGAMERLTSLMYRGYFRVPSAAAANWTIMEFSSGASIEEANFRINLRQQGEQLYLQLLNNYQPVRNSTRVVPLGQWNKLEVRYKSDWSKCAPCTVYSDGFIRVFLNGVKVFEIMEVPTTTSFKYPNGYFRWFVGSAATNISSGSPEVHWDSMQIVD